MLYFLYDFFPFTIAIYLLDASIDIDYLIFGYSCRT